jgi:hypothetical protein
MRRPDSDTNSRKSIDLSLCSQIPILILEELCQETHDSKVTRLVDLTSSNGHPFVG